MDLKFNALTAGDIECRVARATKKGVQLLLYKDARCDMSQLDRAVGPMNWQREHTFKDGHLYCRVGIYDKDREMWVWKEDVGTESNTEKEKGQASDSFKRACVNWGIGRELYTAPFIWVNANDATISEFNGKCKCNDKFIVTKMDVTDNAISDLVITKAKSYGGGGGVVYRMRKEQSPNKPEPIAQGSGPSDYIINDKQVAFIFTQASQCGFSADNVHVGIKKYFGKENIKELKKSEMDILLKKFEQSKETHE